LVSSADTWVGEAQPDLNHGIDPIMLVGPQERSYLMFNLSDIPQGSTVISALLEVCRTNSSGPDTTHELRPATSAWTEDGITWNTQPALSSTTTPYVIAAPSSAGCVSLSVKDDVQTWVDGPTANFGWRIADLDEPNAPLVEWATRENSSSGLRPKLDVTYGP
jgi:hypothetical protein